MRKGLSLFIGLVKERPWVGIISVLVFLFIIIYSICELIASLEGLIMSIIRYVNYRSFLEGNGDNPIIYKGMIVFVGAIILSVLIAWRIWKSISIERSFPLLTLFTVLFTIILYFVSKKIIIPRFIPLDTYDLVYKEINTYFCTARFVYLLVIISMFSGGLICSKIAKTKANKGLNIAAIFVLIGSLIAYIVIGNKMGIILEFMKELVGYIACVAFFIFLGKEMEPGTVDDIYNRTYSAGGPFNYNPSSSSDEESRKKQQEKQKQQQLLFEEKKRKEQLQFEANKHWADAQEQARHGYTDMYKNSMEQHRKKKQW